MATKNQEPIRRKDVIRCEYCGEDYAVSYRRCPFCDGKPRSGGGGGSSSDSGGSRANGGKRLVTNKRGGGYGGGMEPVEIIGIALSIILVIAALYVVYTIISPLLGKGKPDPSSTSSQVSTSQTDPGSTPGGPSTPTPPAVTEITLSNSNITLNHGGSNKFSATLSPEGAEGTIVWSSSDETVATITQDGIVTNNNPTGSVVSVTITASVGDVTATCEVQCKPAPTTVPPDGPGNQGAVNMGTGTVINASGGLNVRSGPGTSYTPVASLLNGNKITVLEDTGTGWYKIQYVDINGKNAEGYVSKDYIRLG